MKYLSFEEGDILIHKRTTTSHYISLRDILSDLENIGLQLH
jgi:hypothetical protein